MRKIGTGKSLAYNEFGYKIPRMTMFKGKKGQIFNRIYAKSQIKGLI
jgi:hypothetical protein